jgi:hypothetical protein
VAQRRLVRHQHLQPGVLPLECEQVGEGLGVLEVGGAGHPQQLVGPGGEGGHEGGKPLPAGELGGGHRRPAVGEARAGQLLVGEALEQLLELDVEGPGHRLDGQPPRAQAGREPVGLEPALHEADHRHRHRPLRIELGRADAEPLASEVLLGPQTAQSVGEGLGLVRGQNDTA